MTSQTRPLEPGETLQRYLASLQAEFRRALAKSLQAAGNPEHIARYDTANVSATFEFVVDGSRRGR
jgi:hypothetical protein